MLLSSQNLVHGQIKRQEFDAPEGVRKFGQINGGGTYQYCGKVKRLEFGLIDGAVTIDASKLEANEIVINDKIDGRSNVILNATGNVTINGKVDGRSILVIQAGGTVTINGKVDGRARVKVKARDLIMNGKVDGGPCTQMFFSAKRDFQINDKIDGGAVLEEGKIDNIFKLEGKPFVDDCQQNDSGEEAKYRIPERARRIADLIASNPC
jgi:ribosome-associated protein YbcJ (S4-like RNA binding protein)